MIPTRNYILLQLCLLLLFLGTTTSQTTTPKGSTAAGTAATGTAPSTTESAEATTENSTKKCKNYEFLCNLGEIEMIALLVGPGVGLLLIAVVIAVACCLCRGKDDDDDVFLERGRTSEMVMNDYRSNMAASSVDGQDDYSHRQKTNPAYVEDDDIAMSPLGHKNMRGPSVSSGSDRMAMDNRRQRMASVDRPYGEDQRRPSSYYPEDDMRRPPGSDPRGRPAQYGDDLRRAGPRYMEEDPRRPPPDSRGRPYAHPGDREDSRRPPSAGPMYDKPDARDGPRPQPRESVVAGKRNWAKQSAAPQQVPPADYDDGFPNPRSSYAGFRQDTNNYY